MRAPQDRFRATNQHGVTLLVMLVILVLGTAAFLVGSLSHWASRIGRDDVTADALAKAKEALVGRAIADATSPGSLPCPDTDNDGSAESTVGQPAGNCPGYIGRLPWKTLGLPDLRDGSGERLWYALSPTFRDYVSLNPVNSSSKGTLLAYDNEGNLLTPSGSEAVAIIFAPGDVVGAQQRDTANENLAANYLDTGPTGINNYTAGGPFVAANKSGSFNDRLLIITSKDIMWGVEERVGKELANAFANYLATNSNRYPYPANFATCTSSSCPGDNTQCIGKIPATNMASSLPSWFTPNRWFDVVYYAAGTNVLPGGTGGGGTGNKGKGKGGKGSGGLSGGGSGIASGSGTGCYAATLNVSGTTVNALFIMPGAALSTQSRTSPNNSLIASQANLSQYFEDAENTNLDNVYVIPGSTASNSNDTLYALP